MWKYGFCSSMHTTWSQAMVPSRYTSRSSGRPTLKLLFSVLSIDTSAHLAASSSCVKGVSTRSRIGLPYLLSPTWKKQVSRVASMKLPAE